MTMDPKWQRETAIRKLGEEVARYPGQPVERLMTRVATYVGATVAQVRGWWAGRPQ
jgi:histidinol-phosphate/aromatic aminotransferase/cobyric acid decarboxylase-like protein